MSAIAALFNLFRNRIAITDMRLNCKRLKEKFRMEIKLNNLTNLKFGRNTFVRFEALVMLFIVDIGEKL